MWPSVSYETYFLLLCDIGNPYYLEHLPNLSMYCQSTYMHNFFNFLGIVVKKWAGGWLRCGAAGRRSNGTPSLCTISSSTTPQATLLCKCSCILAILHYWRLTVRFQNLNLSREHFFKRLKACQLRFVTKPRHLSYANFPLLGYLPS